MSSHFTNLPPELLHHIVEYIINTAQPSVRLEANIKNLCNLELISKQFMLRSFLEKYWSIILYSYIHVRSEIKDGKEIVSPVCQWNHWHKKEETIKKLSKKSYKRMFAILHEAERRRKEKEPHHKANENKFKLCITGPGGSGIHCFIYRYLYDQFIAEYDHPIDETFRRNIHFNQRQLKLEIWDSGFRHDYYLYDQG